MTGLPGQLILEFEDFLSTHVRFPVESQWYSGPNAALDAEKKRAKDKVILSYKGLMVSRNDQRSFYQFKNSMILFDRGTKQLRGVLWEDNFGEESIYESNLWRFLLWEILSLENVFMLHAAALRSPEGTICLFPGLGGCGKTTLSLALISRGWSFLADDQILLHPDGKITPFQTHMHLHPEAAETYPRLGFIRDLPACFELTAKRRVPFEKIATAIVHELDKADAVYFPEIKPVAKSNVRELSKLDALAKILPASFQIFNEEEHAQAHLHAIRKLCESASTYELNFGHDRGIPLE